jgi:hypothetical protein
MTHCTEDDLILHYYGEGSRRGDVEQHLDACAECFTAYRSLARTLQLVPLSDVPERDDAYALEVWQRLRTRLPEPDARWWHASWDWKWGWKPMTIAAAVVTLVVAAFVAGRMWPQAPVAPMAAAVVVDPAEAGERVRLAAIGDHLERSERVLLDLVNADDRADLSAQQTWAADLVDSNRFYRDAATRAGDSLVAAVLDDLERSLLDIVHGPSAPTPAELEAARTRLDAAALLFKVRVLADELHEREVAPVQPRKTT